MDLLMGIDLGSTSLKAIVYDLRGNVVARGSRKTELFHIDADHPEWAVWQPDQIWDGVAGASRDALAELDDPSRIKGVAVTGMGMDGVPVDEAGNILYPFISWHDPRTVPQYDWFKEHVTTEKVFSIGGNPLWPINSVMRILWMAQNEPEILRRTDKWLLIEDFVNFKLCDQRVTDYSMAGCTALFDQRTLDWSDELLGLTGVDRGLLCDAKPSGTRLGEVTAEASAATGLPEGTPIVLGGHDHICGALPVGVIEPGVVLDVTGTWESVLTATAEPVLNPELGVVGMTVQSHVARGLHTIWGGNPAAGMLEWYRDQYGFEARHKAEQDGGSDWNYLIESAAASPPGANRVMFLPHMSAAGCPMVDERSLGAFVGLSNRATNSDMLRAIIEGLDYQFLDIVTAMEDCLDTRLERFIAVGGAVRNRFWMQNKADVIGRPIEVSEVDEATPLGAAMLAGIGVGLYENEKDALEQVAKPVTVYRPDEKIAAGYAKSFEIYKQLYSSLKPINHQLFDGFGA